jgi:hypothetical protein
MIKNSLITRKGILNLKGNQTSNQCAKQGHEVYHYELKVLFSSETKLNSQGWIIDHQLLDDAVQKAQVNSCEIMSNEILNGIETVLLFNQLECIGIKLQIKPAFVIEENSAYFQEYRCHKPEDRAIVMNL